MKIYLSSKGIKPGIDNAKIINRQLEIAKEKSTFVFPDGIFPIGSTIIWDKTANWEGSEDTTLFASNPITLLHLTRGYRSNISKINFKGYYSIYDQSLKLPGLIISAVINMKDCMIRNVWGNGITVTADISSLKTNASACRFDNLEIIECADNGMYFQGGDANQCGIYNADIRDCNGVGLWDNSFLGNQFYACMTHSNKKGSYKAGDETDLNNQNSRAGFWGCYAEMGQGKIILCGASKWYGGLPSDGFDLYNFAKIWV